MKFLIVDDSISLLQGVVSTLRHDGIEVMGVTPHEPQVHGGVQGMSQRIAATLADVILLDHNMPVRNGQQWLERCRVAGIDFSQKRVIGISSHPQPYLQEQIPGNVQSIVAKIREIEAIDK